MPGANNPWATELKAKRKISRTGENSAKEGITMKTASAIKPPSGINTNICVDTENKEKKIVENEGSDKTDIPNDKPEPKKTGLSGQNITNDDPIDTTKDTPNDDSKPVKDKPSTQKIIKKKISKKQMDSKPETKRQVTETNDKENGNRESIRKIDDCPKPHEIGINQTDNARIISKNLNGSEENKEKSNLNDSSKSAREANEKEKPNGKVSLKLPKDKVEKIKPDDVVSSKISKNINEKEKINFIQPPSKAIEKLEKKKSNIVGSVNYSKDNDDTKESNDVVFCKLPTDKVEKIKPDDVVSSKISKNNDEKEQSNFVQPPSKALEKREKKKSNNVEYVNYPKDSDDTKDTNGMISSKLPKDKVEKITQKIQSSNKLIEKLEMLEKNYAKYNDDTEKTNVVPQERDENHVSSKLSNNKEEKSNFLNSSKSTKEEDESELLKHTRKHLKPIIPFKRSTSSVDDSIEENPVERLIRQESTKSPTPKSPPPPELQKASEEDLDKTKANKLVRKKSEEYLTLEYPASVKRNLKSTILPPDKIKVDKNTKKFPQTNNNHLIANRKVSTENANNPICQNQKENLPKVTKPEAGKSDSVNEKRTRKSSRPTSRSGQDTEEWGEEDEWEWEEDSDNAEDENKTAEKDHNEDKEENEEKPVDAKGKADIRIHGNLIKIDRGPIEWSDEEEEEEEEVKPPPVKDPSPLPPGPPPPPPPPPPPQGPPVPPPAPPPPPGAPKAPGKEDDDAARKKRERIENLKKRPTKRPDWNDLMKEIGMHRNSHGLLKKTVTNDRSTPMLTKTKVKGVFIYDSEKDSTDKDIIKEIQTGIKLKKVKVNDRSKPNLKGIKSFKRQVSKADANKSELGFSFGDDVPEEELEDLDKLKDDLEATKQLLELEVRSKQLLEKDNRKLQAEMNKLKAEFEKLRTTGGGTDPDVPPASTSQRKASIKEKRSSMMRLISESAEMNEPESPTCETPPVMETTAEVVTNGPTEEDVAAEELEELKEEVDEARKLAEEWEIKYKEMQRQMEDLEGKGKKHSIAGMEGRPSFERGISTCSSDGVDDTFKRTNIPDENDGDDWMQKREIHQLQGRFKNTRDKKEVIIRERNLLKERIENLKEGIEAEYESRKRLKKEVKEMNAAFLEEMADMEEVALDEEAKKTMEEFYFSDDEAEKITQSCTKKVEKDDDDDDCEEVEEEEEEEVETLEEILQAAEEVDEDDEEGDPGAELFYQEDGIDDEDTSDLDHDKHVDHINSQIEKRTENIQLMRKSNFKLKSKIDILYDILQTQREKHHDLKQELNRMLADIQ